MRVNNLGFSYGNHKVLDDISFQIKRESITTIMGANGCGKSTLLQLMSKNLTPDKGEILLNEKNIQGMKRKQFAREVSIVHQYNTASNDITVEQLVAYGRLPYQNICQNICGISNPKDDELIAWALRETNLEKYAGKEVEKLSGGQKQRVWIAMALAQNTKVLFLDEPTTFLDIRYQIEILNLVKRLNIDYHMTIVMVLHDINQALFYSDEIIALKEGNALAQGKPEDVITKELISSLYGVELEVETVRDKKFVLTV